MPHRQQPLIPESVDLAIVQHGGTLLRELLRDVVHRDTVTRHSRRFARPLMTLALHLLAHPGQLLSLQALCNGLGLPSVAQNGRKVEYLQVVRMMLVITLDQEDTLIEQGQSIRIIPGWKWLD